MTVRVYSLEDDIWAVAPEGRINLPIARAMDDALTGLLDEGRKWVVVDLSAATYITSLGLKVLLVAQRRARVKPATARRLNVYNNCTAAPIAV